MAAVLDQLRRLEMNAERDAKERQALADFANSARDTPSPHHGPHPRQMQHESPTPRRSYTPQSSVDDASLKLNKAFRQVLEAKNPECYSGENIAHYMPWKQALHREVEHLTEMTSMQWINLVKARTKGEAREAVEQACELLSETSPSSSWS